MDVEGAVSDSGLCNEAIGITRGLEGDTTALGIATLVVQWRHNCSC